MNIGLVDVDGHNFPNLALMKLSAYHKLQNDNVEFATILGDYDLIYMSKVFTFTSDENNIYVTTDIKRGGLGTMIMIPSYPTI